MKKFKSIFMVLLALTLTFCFVGCSNLEKFEIENGSLKLSYYDGIADDKTYDSSLFYRNDMLVGEADPGVIYVSKEEDAEHGGYYYMATTGYDDTPSYGESEFLTVAGYPIYRSTDLVNWQKCGALNGYGLKIEKSDWFGFWNWSVWAPEIIRDPSTGKYLMYFSASSKKGNQNTTYNSSDDRMDRMYISVAISDTPFGPYTSVTSENYYGSASATNPYGDVITRDTPCVNFAYYLNKEGYKAENAPSNNVPEDGIWSVIDAHLFLDGDDIYMYFVHQRDKHNSALRANSIWGVKMKDMITPDYSTLTMIAEPGRASVSGTAGNVPSFKGDGDSDIVGEENCGVNEGPWMMKEDGKYYMIYSPFGYDDKRYGLSQAVSDSPLGKFTKLEYGKGNPVIGIDDNNTYLVGSGHGSVLRIGDEIFAITSAHRNPGSPSGSGFLGRGIVIDRLSFVYNDELGMKILNGNGPTASIQPLPLQASGYVNHAKNAKITVSNIKSGNAEFLNDGIIPVYEFARHKELIVDGSTKITISFDTAVDISSIMVYNGFNYETAFDKVSGIKFSLSEKPSWYNGADIKSCFIDDLKFNPDYVLSHDEKIIQRGASAIAQFKPIKVTKIEIVISSKFFTVDESTSEKNNLISLSEIMVLGKGEAL